MKETSDDALADIIRQFAHVKAKEADLESAKESLKDRKEELKAAADRLDKMLTEAIEPGIFGDPSPQLVAAAQSLKAALARLGATMTVSTD